MQIANIKTQKMFDNTAIADRLRTVSWSNSINQTVVLTGLHAKLSHSP